MKTGTLFVVATPIGNLEDISPRAVSTLGTADLILAEDTRTFRNIATRFSVSTPVRSYHDHNEARESAKAIEVLKSGSNVALVSDAGTPTVSDPGYRLIRSAQEQGVSVVPVPGACAAVAALSVCGFETNQFQFRGFLPRKQGARGRELSRAIEADSVTIFYESPHRIVKVLGELAALDTERDVFVAREMTKIYEEYVRGTAGEVFENFSSRKSIKGEFVLIVRGRVVKRGRGKKKYEVFGSEDE